MISLNKQQLNFTHRCVIIGSFRKHYDQIVNVIEDFNAAEIEVLSPKKAKILNPTDEFVIFDYDPEGLSEKELEDLVLKKMHGSDFVYLVNPEGYIGRSAAFEMGYCAARGFKIFAMEDSTELCMKYTHGVKSPKEVIQYLKRAKEYA